MFDYSRNFCGHSWIQHPKTWTRPLWHRSPWPSLYTEHLTRRTACAHFFSCTQASSHAPSCTWLKGRRGLKFNSGFGRNVSECAKKVISSLVVMSPWHPRLRLLFVLLGIRPITTAAPLRGEYGRMADWTSQTQVGSPTLASTLARSTRRSICPQTASTRTRRSQPLTSSPPGSVLKAAAAIPTLLSLGQPTRCRELWRSNNSVSCSFSNLTGNNTETGNQPCVNC